MKKTFKLDFNLDAWLNSIEIEAETEEEAIRLLEDEIEKVLSDICYVKNISITDVDTEIVDATYKVKLFGINWDVEEEDIVEDVLSDYPAVEEDSEEWYDLIHEYIENKKLILPKNYEIIVNATTEQAAIDEAIDLITDEVGWLINDFDYNTIEML